jgi:arylsulfatase A-like enzyme
MSSNSNIDTLQPGSTAALNKTQPTIAELLKQQRYETHIIGKWHLGYHDRSVMPLARGFDTQLGYLQGNVDYFTKQNVIPIADISGYDFWINDTVNRNTNYTIDLYNQEMERVFDSSTGYAKKKNKLNFF